MVVVHFVYVYGYYNGGNKIMVRILLNKQDLRNILSWAGLVKARADDICIPFEKDEEETLMKIKKANNQKKI